MLKNIALAGIFAVTSFVSFGPATVNAKPVENTVSASTISPIMKGVCPSGFCR